MLTTERERERERENSVVRGDKLPNVDQLMRSPSGVNSFSANVSLRPARKEGRKERERERDRERGEGCGGRGKGRCQEI